MFAGNHPTQPQHIVDSPKDPPNQDLVCVHTRTHRLKGHSLILEYAASHQLFQERAQDFEKGGLGWSDKLLGGNQMTAAKDTVT